MILKAEMICMDIHMRCVYLKMANKYGKKNGAAKAVKRPVNPMANPEKAPVSRFI